MNTLRRKKLRPHQSRLFAERRKERLALGIGAAFIAAISWIFVISRVTALPYLSIESIHVYGADPELVPAIQNAAAAAIQGSYFGLFPRSDALIYPRGAVARAVASSSPQVSTVDVGRDSLNDMVISVSERPPAAAVCGDLPDFDAAGGLIFDDQCYLADERGLIFGAAPAMEAGQPASAASAGPLDRYYVPDLPASPIGTYATTTGEFVALQAFLASARSTGIVTEGVLMKDSGEYELYGDNPGAPVALAAPGASVATTSSPDDLVIIYFNDAAGLADEAADLSAFWIGMEKPADPATPHPAFISIDLRYGTNVFYRLQK